MSGSKQQQEALQKLQPVCIFMKYSNSDKSACFTAALDENWCSLVVVEEINCRVGGGKTMSNISFLAATTYNGEEGMVGSMEMASDKDWRPPSFIRTAQKQRVGTKFASDLLTKSCSITIRV